MSMKQGANYVKLPDGKGWLTQYTKGNVTFSITQPAFFSEYDVKKVCEKMSECDIMQMHLQENLNFIYSHITWPNRQII